MIPRGVRALARPYRRMDGVIGVFWGMPCPGGVPDEDPARRAVVVHVESRTRATELEPAHGLVESAGAPRVVFQAVGRPGAGAGTLGMVIARDAQGNWDRRSSITAVAPGGDELLVSGHGGLPLRGGRLVSPWSAPGVPADILIEQGGQRFGGRVVDGACAGRFDWARVRLEDPLADWTHPIGGMPRWQVAPETTRAVGRRVRLLSPVTGHTRSGRVTQTSVTSVDMVVPGGREQSFREVYFVTADGGGVISEDGDSGSLIWDEGLRPIGTVLGRSFYPNVVGTYVISNLPVAGMFNRYYQE